MLRVLGSRRCAAFLALLTSACSIDLKVAPELQPLPEPQELVVLQSWGNDGAQEPWTPTWHLHPALGGPFVDPSGTIRIAGEAGDLVVSVSLAGANEVGAAWGVADGASAALLGGSPGAMAPRELTLRFEGDGAGAAVLGLASAPAGYAAVGTLRGGALLPSLSGPSSAFAVVGTIGDAPAHTYEAFVEGGRDVVLAAAARADGWTYAAGGYFNNSMAPVTLDGQALDEFAAFRDDGTSNRSHPLLMGFDVEEPTKGVGMSLGNDPDAAAFSDLAAVDAADSRVVVAGRVASYLSVIEPDASEAIITEAVSKVEGDNALVLEHFMPLLLELERKPAAAVGGPDFVHVWHHPISEGTERIVRGELDAVRILASGDVLACGRYRGGPPEPGCGTEESGWLLLRRRRDATGDSPAECVALGGGERGQCTQLLEASDGAIWLGGIGESDGTAPPGVLLRLDAALSPTHRLQLPAAGALVSGLAPAADGGVHVVGSFARELSDVPRGGAVTPAAGGDADWDFFLARCTP